jgi:hypothetical protein
MVLLFLVRKNILCVSVLKAFYESLKANARCMTNSMSHIPKHWTEVQAKAGNKEFAGVALWKPYSPK